jgi:S1-C subfamily serine protease
MRQRSKVLRANAGVGCLLLVMTLCGCVENLAEAPSKDAASAVAPAATHGFLGLTFQSIEESPLTITGTVPASGAEEAGISADDQLTEVAGIPNPNIQQIYEVIVQTTPGDVLQIGILRGEVELTLPVRLISQEDVQNAMIATQSEK